MESRLKEQTKLIDLLKQECDSYSSKLAQFEEEKSMKLDEQINFKQTIETKEKHYQALIEEINELNRKKQQQDQNEINELNAKLNELKELVETKKLVATQSLKSSPYSSSIYDNNSEANLKYENQQLNKQLEELKFSYDDLIDEKNQLLITLNELKQKSQSSGHSKSNSTSNENNINEVIKLNTLLKEKDKIIIDLETKLALVKSQSKTNNSYYSRSLMVESTSDHESSFDATRNRLNSSLSMCLESTEIDYLRQIVYSYMMGTDPLVGLIF